MKKVFIAAAVLLCAAAVALGAPAKKKKPARGTPAKTVQRAPAPARKGPVVRKAPARKAPPPARPVRKAPPPVRPVPVAVKAPPKPAASYRPAGTVAFANLETVAAAVASIAAPGSRDPILTVAVPRAIRAQRALKLFGAMRPGAHAAAVCFVNPALVARIAATKRPSEADLERVKRWSIVYPTALTEAAFRQRHPEARAEADGTLCLPGPRGVRTLWAWFAPGGGWAVLAPAPAFAKSAYAAAAGTLAQPLGRDLARVSMDAMGARAAFGTDFCGGGVITLRMTSAGLEMRGTLHLGTPTRPVLPPTSLAFAGVPANAPLFGVTTEPDDIRSADVFAFVGPDLSRFIRKSLLCLRGPVASTYYLAGDASVKASAPQQRLVQILPEAKRRPTANVMFCSFTQVLKICLPKVAATLMPLESAKLQVGLRLLRRARGDGAGFMGWRDATGDHFLLRVSRDDLWATSALWSTLLF